MVEGKKLPQPLGVLKFGSMKLLRVLGASISVIENFRHIWQGFLQSIANGYVFRPNKMKFPEICLLHNCVSSFIIGKSESNLGYVVYSSSSIIFFSRSPPPELSIVEKEIYSWECISLLDVGNLVTHFSLQKIECLL